MTSTGDGKEFDFASAASYKSIETEITSTTTLNYIFKYDVDVT